MKQNKIVLVLTVFGILMISIIGCKKEDEVKSDKIIFNPTTTYGSVKDIDSNIYKTVTISGHEWMAENLKVTHYNDSSEIPNITYDSEWFSQFKGAYCWMNNDMEKYKGIYGALYNFYAVVDNRNLCPIGWHVPSYSEWTELIETAGGEYVAGAKLKEEGLTHWMYKNNSDNGSGFSALPGGIRGANGYFSSIGQEGYWWTSTAIDQTYAINCNLSYNNDTIEVFGGVKMLGFSVRCKKDEISVKTLLVSDIKQTTATSGGNIISKNGATITERGVCWSTNQNPTIADSKTSDGNGIGVYASYMTNLNLNTTYYVRAYAINGGEVFYGNELSFATLELSLPSITTNTISNLAASTLTCGGNVTENGGQIVTSRGTCWSTLPNPTIELSTKTVNGSGLGAFTSNITGLTENTVYYFRAYATNTKGTAYGNEISTKTLPGYLPTIITYSVTPINATSVSCGGNVTSNGNLAVTERGVCWGISTNPTIESGNKLINGSGVGQFTCKVEGLEDSTLYYIRAYAINSKGTSYGNELTFTTQTVTLPTITTLNPEISQTSSICGGNISDNGGLPIIARGVCWNTSPNPSIDLSTKTVDGTGNGIFTSNIGGLVSNSTYYVRAYATNSIGTAYGNEIIMKTYTGTVTDIDGNVYNTVTIGTQVWIAENLKTTTFRNGDPIPNITGTSEWVINASGAYCWYNNDVNNKNTYGALYNFYAVADSRLLCPSGWHVPTFAEWQTTENYLGYPSGVKMRAIVLWDYPNKGADNSSGFKAYPGGARFRDGDFARMGNGGFWWTINSAKGYYYAYYFSIDGSFETPFIGDESIIDGFSVRCLKDQ